jgi:hypothetical protein
MKTWEAMVALPSPNGSLIPTRMTGEFQNYVQAQAYFSKFGKIVMGPRIVN